MGYKQVRLRPFVGVISPPNGTGACTLHTVTELQRTTDAVAIISMQKIVVFGLHRTVGPATPDVTTAHADTSLVTLKSEWQCIQV